MTDGAGGVLALNKYDEYGTPAATNAGRFQYTGQMWFGETGTYNYKARTYAPHLGRFLQPDPIGYKGGINLYPYVGNDPVNFVDPLGLTGHGTSPPPVDVGPTIVVTLTRRPLPALWYTYLDPVNLAEGLRGLGGGGGGRATGTAPTVPTPQKGKPWSGSCDRALQEPGKIEATADQFSAVLALGWSYSNGEWRNLQTGTWGTYSSSNFSVGFDFGISFGSVTANRLSDFVGHGDSWSGGASIRGVGVSYGRSYDLDGNRTGSSGGVGAGGFGRIGGSGSFGETKLGKICHYRN